ncbi:MAG: DUF1264 domain-containing protein [Bacillati bacterium ANGP1]|uniref:DUF1264 domain-containing protein n=1 Tax=Candidatus Segetimicrobium genomatis TaxID=2569760 RepID=A0A537J757_9BACT|nr:MAG: DUF1264 domain-containing protein [Terrabacteria group bacterium ANGP1]
MKANAVMVGTIAVVMAALALFGGSQRAPAGNPKPSEGWTLHIDALLHYPGKPSMVAHHYCKPVSGLIECQLYDSDAPDARLVGIETIVDAATYAKFPEAEKKLWHYHKTEIAKVSATLPDLSPEEADKVVKSILETYGKIYLVWDPGRQSMPTGYPTVTVLKTN